MASQATQAGQKDKKVIKKRNLQIIEFLRKEMTEGKHHSKNLEELLCYSGQVVIKKGD